MSKIEQIEVDSSEITKIFIEYESQIVERFKQKYNIVDLKDKGILQHRTKSAWRHCAVLPRISSETRAVLPGNISQLEYSTKP